MSEENGVLKFDSLELIEVPVELEGKKYVLREADGKASVAYRNALVASTTISPEGKPTSVHNIASIEPLLVSMCLYRVSNSPGGGTTYTQVTQGEIEKWPARIQKVLYEKARDISRLGAEDEEPEKNLSKSTTDGSD